MFLVNVTHWLPREWEEGTIFFFFSFPWSVITNKCVSNFLYDICIYIYIDDEEGTIWNEGDEFVLSIYGLLIMILQSALRESEIPRITHTKAPSKECIVPWSPFMISSINIFWNKIYVANLILHICSIIHFSCINIFFKLVFIVPVNLLNFYLGSYSSFENFAIDSL